MSKARLLTDDEPVDPKMNPIITLEEAREDAHRFGARTAIEIMEQLKRTSLTRLQFIEVVTRNNDCPFDWDWEHEGDMPDQLICDPDYDEDGRVQDLVPKYLRKVKRHMFKDCVYYPTE